MVDPKKIANNILDYLLDPTKIPVEQRLYFRPEEKLQNAVLDKARSDAYRAYGEQRHNSDFYPARNRLINLERQAFQMDRKSLIASFDILSQNFRKKDDPFSVQLRTMALAVSRMQDDELSSRLADGAPDLGTLVEAKSYPTFKCPECGTKVLEQTGYCVKCKKKVKKAEEEATAQLMSGPAKPEVTRTPLMERGPHGRMRSLPEIVEYLREHESEVNKTPWIKKLFEALTGKTAEDETAETVTAEDWNDNWTDEASSVVASYLVEDVVGDEEPEPMKEEAPKLEETPKVEVPKTEAPKEEPKKDEPKKEEPPVKEKAAKAESEEKSSLKKEAGKIKGPGVPDGTGPMKDSPACPFSTEKKEEKDTEKAPVEEKKEEKKAATEELKKEEKKADVVVNTDILATFGGIEIPQGITTTDDPGVGSLTAEEQERLAKLF